MSELLAAALKRAQRGAYVLPLWWTDARGVCHCPRGAACKHPGKHPIGQLVPRGLLGATCDPDHLREWWEAYPRANIGDRTDERPRFDIDLADVASALARDVALPLETEVVSTPSRGGLHLSFVTGQQMRGQTLRLADGRTLGELKAEGGYVVVPPSEIAGRPYVLLSPEDVPPIELADPLKWLGDLLAAFDFPLSQGDDPRKDYQSIGGIIHEGEGRHNAIKSYAGRIWVEGMSPEAFVAALEAVNTFQCRPPLPAGELEEIARWFIDSREQGRVNGSARRLDEEARADLGAAPLSHRNGATPAPPAEEASLLPENHYVPRYVRYARSRTDAPPQYHETLAVVQLSAAVGHTVRIPLAAKPHGMYCNLWALLLGDSTLFRKSTSEDLAVDLLQAIDSAMFLANDQSPQGFVQEMADHNGRTAVWHRDEFRSFLAQLKAATWMAGGKELLMKLYDGSDYHRRLRTKTVKGVPIVDEEHIREPYLVAIAAGVTSRIVEVLTVDDVIDGFLPRFIVVVPKGRPQRRRAATITPAIEAERRALVESLAGIHRGFAERGECSVQFAPDVWDRWNDYAAQLEDGAGDSSTPELFGPIAGRMADNALKIAALLQAADGAPAKGSNLHISMGSLEAAIELCERLRKDAEELAMEIGEGITERRLRRLADLAQRRPGISRSEVAKLLKLDKKQMDDLEATALDRGLVACGTTNTGGRPRKGYWTV